MNFQISYLVVLPRISLIVSRNWVLDTITIYLDILFGQFFKAILVSIYRKLHCSEQKAFLTY